jgi:hypothetical protein
MRCFDGLRYECEADRVFCSPSLPNEAYLPRTCVSVDGLHRMVSVQGRSQLYQWTDRMKFVCIPSSVEEISVESFYKQANLSEVVFEHGTRVSGIGDLAFAVCFSLSSICIPCSVEMIGQKCFAGCRGLSVVTFELPSRLSRIEKSAFAACSSLSSINSPCSVEVLCKRCFDWCAGLSRVGFESVSQLCRIEPDAFSWCSSLNSICIPSSVEELGERERSDCRYSDPDLIA